MDGSRGSRAGRARVVGTRRARARSRRPRSPPRSPCRRSAGAHGTVAAAHRRACAAGVRDAAARRRARGRARGGAAAARRPSGGGGRTRARPAGSAAPRRRAAPAAKRRRLSAAGPPDVVGAWDGAPRTHHPQRRARTRACRRSTRSCCPRARCSCSARRSGRPRRASRASNESAAVLFDPSRAHSRTSRRRSIRAPGMRSNIYCGPRPLMSDGRVPASSAATSTTTRSRPATTTTAGLNHTWTFDPRTEGVAAATRTSAAATTRGTSPAAAGIRARCSCPTAGRDRRVGITESRHAR